MGTFRRTLRGLALGCASVALLQGAAFAQQAEPVHVDIPAQSLSTALTEFGRQTNAEIVFSPEAVAQLRAPSVEGELSPEEALSRLLAGTNLTYRRNSDGVFVVQDPNSPTRLGDARDAAPSEDVVEDDAIVVVGTNIRGVYPASSPVEIFTAEDIAGTGATTTEQFISRLSQNLNSTNSSAPNAVSVSNPNREAINSVDLRGLGVGTTLVLLNGRRVSTAGDAQGVDISMIPVSALERVEVLTDGASAIYGSDAVGGVVNFILRDDLDGMEARANYGGVTSGGMRQGGAGLTAGTRWESGSALASLSYFSASALENADRTYASTNPGTLTPTDQRAGGFASLNQQITEDITLSADVAYAQREIKSRFNDGTSDFTTSSDSDQFFGNIGVQWDLTTDLQASVHLTHSENDTDNLTRVVTGGVGSSFTTDSYGRTTDATAILDGAAFNLPAGDVRFSVGAGVTHERFAGQRLPRRELRRDTTYGFGELFVPLASEGMNVPFLRRLELSLAARYTNFEDASDPALGVDFGSRTSPKVGVLWSPIEGLNVRATYGESFRAAPLNQLDPSSAGNSIFMPSAFGLPDIWSPTNQTTLLNVNGAGNPSLGPETAESYSFGFDLEPPSLEGLRISATYFNIAYQDRIAQPDTTGISVVFPQDFPDLFILNPTAAQIEAILRNSNNFFNLSGIDLSDPAAAAAQLAALPSIVILDNRVRNLARSDVDGLDFSIRQRWTSSIGDVAVGAQATYVLNYEQQVTPNAPVLTVVDTVLQPADLRASVFVELSTERFDTRLAANYVDGYDNPFSAAQSDVDSWTTFDWSGAYRWGGDTDGVLLRLSVQNLFDEDPPFVGRTATGAGLLTPIGFDPVNANPLGRFISFEVVKQW